MSATIFGDRFLGYRKPAWHNIGQVFDEQMTAVDAVSKAGLDYQVVKSQLTSSINGQFIETDRWGIFREPVPDDDKYAYLGTASKDYPIVQNAQIAELIDPLTKLWPVETVGALGQGETIFFALDAGENEIGGEPTKLFFLITDTRDGGTSMKIAFTPVRVVCQNTLVSGLKQASISASLTHDQNFHGMLQTRVNLLQKMQRAMTTSLATFETLAKTAITSDEADAIIASAYPFPAKPSKTRLLEEVDFDAAQEFEALAQLYDSAKQAEAGWDYRVSRLQTFRDGARQLFDKQNDEHSAIAGTAWGAYNAVVEFADFREGADSIPVSTLFGYRAREKTGAFNTAMTYIR